MFSLTVFVGTGMWQLLYKTEEKAKQHFSDINAMKPEDIHFLQDDFGAMLSVRGSSHHGAVLENLDETKLAHCERALYQQRVQIAAQNMAQADATIRTARSMAGPAIIAPMGAGPNGGRAF